MASSLLTWLVLAGALLIVSCEPANAPMMKRETRAVKIEFKRTGGFSPITNASGVVDFQGSSAEVTSQPAGYRRSLTADETANLQTLSSPEKLGARKLASAPGAVRDGFHYEVTVNTADGKRHTYNSNELQKLPDAGAQLIQWVQEESQKILAHRAGGR